MSSLWYPHVKEAPLQGLTGMWGGTSSNLTGGPRGPATKAPGDGTWVESGLWLRWDFAEYNYSAGQGTVNDTSGNDRNGIINNSGGASNRYSTQNAGYLDWDNNSSQNYYINNGQGTNTSPLTLEFWCDFKSTSEMGLFDTGPNQGNTIRNREFSGMPSGIDWWDAEPKQDLSVVANWAHYAINFYIQGNSRHIDAFRNGASTGSANYSNSTQNEWDNYCVGVYNYSSPWSGKLAVAAVYNDILTSAEIQQNYNALKHRFGL